MIGIVSGDFLDFRNGKSIIYLGNQFFKHIFWGTPSENTRMGLEWIRHRDYQGMILQPYNGNMRGEKNRIFSFFFSSEHWG